MKITNKNLIFKTLGILTILAIAIVFVPSKASAEYATYQFNYSDRPFNNPYPTQPVYQPVFYNTTPTYPNYVNSNTRANNTTSTNNTNSSTNTNTTENNTDTTTTSNTVGKTDTSVNAYKNLTANAIFGTRSFMPSGLIQWILLAIFILLIIIFVRRVTGSDEKYHNTPLKHA